ncbi:MAG: heavy-metal-associated domain-containing protein [Candidatus Rokubacteria bacterium]|jgi:copper chaperone|nr:heavy-metal-associated domain-containing protein [Candidatus Rokubacteria bacterium]
MERVYRVPKIKCEGCADTITKALNGLPGVTTARVTIPAKEVRVEFDPGRLDEGRVRQTLIEAGFPPA